MIKESAQSMILLSGPVGSGKSTIAPELIKASSGPVAYIEGDKFWSFIVKGSVYCKNFTI